MITHHHRLIPQNLAAVLSLAVAASLTLSAACSPASSGSDTQRVHAAAPSLVLM